MFGDFGQELYSIYQSFEGYSAYIGNDWISYIRYLFLKKYSQGYKGTNKRKSPVFYPWYGGFLGNTSFNIIYQEDNIATPPSSPTPKSPTNKRTKKGGGRRRSTRTCATLPKLSANHKIRT